MPGILEERLSKSTEKSKTSSNVKKTANIEGKRQSKKDFSHVDDGKEVSYAFNKNMDTSQMQPPKGEEKDIAEKGNLSTQKKEILDGEALSHEDAKFISNLETIMSEDEDKKDQKKDRAIRKVGVMIMSLLCIYMVMLIYGAATTEYRYNENGEVEPVVLSVDDIQAKNEFSSVLAMYLQTRELYETILTLDYRMASGVEDSMGIAPEYEAALDTVSTLAVQIDASNINSRYNQIKSMLLTWIQTHCAAYCQFMSAAITQNDNNAAAEAIAAREVVNSYFQQITMNIVSLGDDMGLFDLADIKEWSPDTYIKSTYEGLE